MTIAQLIEEILFEAWKGSEQLEAFQQAFRDKVPVPCEGSIAGEPVTALRFDFDGSERRGLTVKVQRQDGRAFVLSAADIAFPPRTPGARYVSAYRQWMGAGPIVKPQPRVAKPAKTADALDVVLLSKGDRLAECRLLTDDAPFALHPRRSVPIVPGEIATVTPSMPRPAGSTGHLTGTVDSTRLDVKALGLVPLKLRDFGLWDPKKEYWCDPGERIPAYARPIIAWGPRRQYEMEQVLPGEIMDEMSDPISDSNDLRDAGDHRGAYRLLMETCRLDLRCLDAHSHLGLFEFDRNPGLAIRHYEVGLRIGELSLPENFNGLLPWGMIDNRPFLRCLQGYGLCLWRLERFDEALQVFDRMLWLNPGDNQGVRCLIGDVKAKRRWKPDRF